MADGPRVLVVDSESETVEVLRAVFEPRGLRVDRVRELSTNSDPKAPSLLVIDDDGFSAEIRETEGWNGVPRVVLGSARLSTDHDGESGQYLQKPFQYPELIRLVDQLLVDHAA